MNDARLNRLLSELVDSEAANDLGHGCPGLPLLFAHETEGRPLGEHERHVQACPRCARRLEIIRAEVATAQVLLRSSGAATLLGTASRIVRSRLVVATGGLAAAACLMLVFFLVPSDVRADSWTDAQEAEGRWEFDEALVAVNQVLDEQPGHLEALLLKARVLAKKKRIQEATAIIEGLLRREPTAWAANLQLGTLLEPTDRGRARMLQSTALRHMPDTAQAWYLRGLVTNDWPEAHSCFSKTLDHEPDHAWARLRRAWANYELRDFATMRADAEALSVLRPEWVNTWDTLGVALDRLGRGDAAVQAFTRAINLDPENEASFCHRATALLTAGQYEAAARDCETAIELDKNSKEAYWHAGQAYRFLGDVEKAVESFEHHVQVKPEHASGYLQLAIVLREVGRAEDAKVVLQRCVNRDDIGAWQRMLLEFCLGHRKEDAVLASAGDHQLRRCEAWYYIGEQRLAIGDRLGASRAFEEATTATALKSVALSYAAWRLAPGP